MEESEEDKEIRAERMVHRFKQKFNDQFGTIPFVRYTVKVKNTVPLNIIEECANKVLNGLGAYYYDRGVATTYHDEDVLLCRWIYYSIAYKAGYSKTQMAHAVKQTPQSVGYGLGKINKILKHDGREKDIYQKIKQNIEDSIFRGLEDVGNTNKGRIDSVEPTIDA